MADLARSAGRNDLVRMPVSQFAATTAQQNAAAGLLDLFERHGSDKGAHLYHHLYGTILADNQNIESVMEVGLGTNFEDVVSGMGRHGKPEASLRAFRDFCPQAKVYGADIDRRILFSESRIETFFVGQTDPASFETLGAALPNSFDLIIDDGLHSPDANLATLNFAITNPADGSSLRTFRKLRCRCGRSCRGSCRAVATFLKPRAHSSLRFRRQTDPGDHPGQTFTSAIDYPTRC